jgi:alanyl-tRNA synthetase
MKSSELKKKYIEFFKKKKHKEIHNASLIPENDPTVLFTTAGMHPLTPYLLGQKHPLGKRLVNVQKCLRTGDIENVGDDFHLTFFEMLGNWSLGDYWKEESIKMSFEFLTNKKWLGFSIDKLAISVFKGDQESFNEWNKLGIPKEKITYLGKKDNWWGPVGNTGPCGPDTEIFYWAGEEKAPKVFNPENKKWVEIWNNVFMQYNKNSDSKLTELKQKNVDTGMGFDRILTILEGKKSVYETSLFSPIIKMIKDLTKINKKQEVIVRKIADHLRTCVFILGDEKGIVPSNTEAGYVLRRLIRTSMRYGKLLGLEGTFSKDIAELVIEMYKKDYPLLDKNRKIILDELVKEELKFADSLEHGLKKLEKLAKGKKISGKNAFLLFQSFGFPLEMTIDLAKEANILVDVKGFEKELNKHRKLSQTATKGKFGSGLADNSVEVTKLHTTSHLLLATLRKLFGKEIYQKGSNITKERLRFDFNFDRKLDSKEIEKIEEIINQKIKDNIPIVKSVMSFEDAKKKGASGIFESKYGKKVNVYSISSFSKEICSGPHVKNTKELGKFRIIKEQSSSAGVRRIRAVLK